MFGLIGDIVDGAAELVSNELEEFVDNPAGYIVQSALSPVTNTLDVLEGLSEGEIRTLAIAKLGADVVAGMAMSEIMEVLLED